MSRYDWVSVALLCTFIVVCAVLLAAVSTRIHYPATITTTTTAAVSHIVYNYVIGEYVFAAVVITVVIAAFVAVIWLVKR